MQLLVGLSFNKGLSDKGIIAQCGRDVYKMMYTITNTSSDHQKRRVVVLHACVYCTFQASASNVCMGSINCTEQCQPINSCFQLTASINTSSQCHSLCARCVDIHSPLHLTEVLRNYNTSKGNFLYYEQHRSPVTVSQHLNPHLVKKKQPKNMN